jgi:membrane-bound lytic murein transglycosylase B
VTAGSIASALVVASITPGGAAPAAPAMPAAATTALAAPAAAASTAHASLAPELAAVPVDSPKFRTVRAFYDAARAAYAQATATIADATAQVTQLTSAQDALAARQTRVAAVRATIAAEVAQLQASLRDLAVRSYIENTGGDDLSGLDAVGATERGSQEMIVRTAGESTRADLATANSRLAATDRELAKIDAEIRDTRARLDEQAGRLSSATADQAAAAADIRRLHVDYDDARALATVRGTDLTLVAMDAYWRAALVLSLEDPSCGISWWAMAGIGKVESRHGTYGGATLDPAGQTSRHIVGIALDGTGGTAAIGDTDGGALDGDPTVDRAVGPMQFIPSTWRRWGRDGNDDGDEDPNNIYDAALAAAGYLCVSGALTTDAGLTRAYLSYNASDVYAAEVLGFAHEYAKVTIPDPPAPDAGVLAALAAAGG